METKSIFASKTFWGAIITGLSTMGALFGVQITGEDQAVLVDGVSAVGAVVGVVLAIVGRYRADKKIG